MQFTQIFPKKIVLSDFTYKLLKVAVFIFLLSYSVYIVLNKDVVSVHLLVEFLFLIKNQGWIVVIVGLLLPLNWGLEAKKWQLMVQKTGDISFANAYSGVLTGVSMGFATPHGLGDYFGRILQLPIRDRSRLVGAVFLTRFSQLAITLLFGGLSLVFFIDSVLSPDPLIQFYFLFFTFISVAGVLFVVLFYQHLVLLLKKIPVFWKYFGKLSEYNGQEVANVFFLSLLRYLVFCLQFILLLIAFNVSTDWPLLFIGVNLVFLAKSIIPTLFELGVREYAAVYFFSGFSIGSEKVVLASLMLWVINLLLPALVGMFLVFKLKLRVK